MISKEEFMAQAETYWDSLSVLEDKCPDFYAYESQFEQLWVDFGHQTLQGLIGTEKKDRRVKKSPDAI
jgi:hypothetical protein